MDRWERILDKVFARVLADGDEDARGLKTTSDSDISEGTQCSRESARALRTKEERRVYTEMCQLLDNTLMLTVDTLLNGPYAATAVEGRKDDLIQKDFSELPYPHRDGGSPLSLTSKDDKDASYWRETSPFSSSVSTLSSVNSLTSLTSKSEMDVCLLKQRLEHMRRENNSLKEINNRLHQQLLHDDDDDNKYTHTYNHKYNHSREQSLSAEHSLYAISNSTSSLACCNSDYSGDTQPSFSVPAATISSSSCCVHEVQEKALIAELVHTKCLLALALSKVEEEKLHRFKIMRAVDKLL